MPRGKELTVVEKAQIEALRTAGKSYTFIANQLHRSKGCIQDFVTKRRSYGLKRRSGRPKKLTEREERHISRIASNSTKSANEIKRECQLQVSKGTIIRALNRNPNLKREKMMSAPKLKMEHKIQRLEFAKKNMRTDWDMVRTLTIFSLSINHLYNM